MLPLRDITVEVNSAQSAQIESWLLGHGRLPEVGSGAPPGRVRYVVHEASHFDIFQLRSLGGVVTKDAK